MKSVGIQKSNTHKYLDYHVKKYFTDKKHETRELHFAGYFIWAIEMYFAYSSKNIVILVILIVLLVFSLMLVLIPTIISKKPETYILAWAYTFTLYAILFSIMPYMAIWFFWEIQSPIILYGLILAGYFIVGIMSPGIIRKRINKGVFREGSSYKDNPISVRTGIVMGVFLIAISRIVPLGAAAPILLLLIVSWGLGHKCHLYWCYYMFRKDTLQIGKYKTKRLKTAWVSDNDEKHSKLQLLR